jgi:hypothetical protein
MKSPLFVLLLLIPVTVRAANTPQFNGYQGDLNGDGSTDVFVERVSPGATDGSMNSYVLLNTGSSSPVAVVPGEPGYDYYSSLARSLPNPRVIVGFTDLNADGEIDHIIPGSKFFSEAVVFAPGAQADKGRPQGVTVLTPQLRAILADLRNWMSDGTYFISGAAETTEKRAQGAQAEGGCYRNSDGILVCNWPGFWRNFPHQPCRGLGCPGWEGPPPRQIPEGHGPGGPPNRPWQAGQIDAVMFAGYIEAILTADPPSGDDLRRLSDHFRRLFGVPMFRFDQAGNWVQQPDDAHCPKDKQNRRGECGWAPKPDWVVLWLENVARYHRPELPVPSPEPRRHDYIVRTEICSKDTPGCFLGNIACWGRHYHAPLKINGYARSVAHGEEVMLRGGGSNPIKVAVGPESGLSRYAIAQITLRGHWMHGSGSGEWPNCPRSVPQQGRGTAPEGCNQVHREPAEEFGKVVMYTRGTGVSNVAFVNDLAGRALMRALDRQMIDEISVRPNGMPVGIKSCPSLQ